MKGENILMLAKTAIVGSSIADALGVPVEFKSREYLFNNPVKSYMEYGTHYQPKGTWSDDTSMTLCLMESMIECKRIDYCNIMDKFVLWKDKGEFTPFNYTFDIGNATYKAIKRYQSGIQPTECGGSAIYDNGNGSLMRIMPMVLFVYKNKEQLGNKGIAESIINCSKLTHAHPISLSACMIFYGIIERLLERDIDDKMKILDEGIIRGKSLYTEYTGQNITHEYDRIKDVRRFALNSSDEIKSSGYVVDTLESAIWCFVNYNSYKESVLAAVNLGDDTDTVGAVTGGLAALYYGYEEIPDRWIEGLQRREYVIELCNKFDDFLTL